MCRRCRKGACPSDVDSSTASLLLPARKPKGGLIESVDARGLVEDGGSCVSREPRRRYETARQPRRHAYYQPPWGAAARRTCTVKHQRPSA